ncbi:cytoplasmic protein [Cryptococcus wingfieldii CBS 7118]|uniref:Cytoplasmic protein n=1 Tax=Cryptococcus wingfieldii CBS 7118 TaxID=1295528 RepID=A0A1E3JHP8_9TREE|nr:cytoplasmic protein [Cryptococcus wingfieldii CBS 7118]ODN99616.1 cytoplasmic protein [Cryptococcus wingfieldii CBS 7118]
MAANKNNQIVLNERPQRGPVTDTTFRSNVVDVPEPKDGEVVVRIDYASVDPTMRGWVDDVRSYLPPVEIGAAMRAPGLGTVVASKSDAFKVGDLAVGLLGWQEYYVGSAEGLTKRVTPEGGKDIDHLGLFGMTGMTAYVGMFEIGKLQDGDHVLISGAAGAVGQTATQIALAHPNCKVSVIAGSKEKLDYLKKLGVHNALNYKDADFKEQFHKIGNVDVYFDNVGGSILDLTLRQLNPHARIIGCGAISAYNAEKPEPIYNYFCLITMKSTFRGFIVMEHANLFPEGIAYFADLVKKGKMEFNYHVVDGLDNAVTALREMFDGKNLGKTVVRVSKEAVRQSKL